jgi:hypothetical protein
LVIPLTNRPGGILIQGFNQDGQRSLGTIVLDLDIDGFRSQVNCQVIDAPTSYNLLLERPWIHKYRVVPSSVHQCFKYSQDGIPRRIIADTRPFAVSESYFADYQYYKSSEESGKQDNVQASPNNPGESSSQQSRVPFLIRGLPPIGEHDKSQASQSSSQPQKANPQSGIKNESTPAGHSSPSPKLY